MQTTMCKLIMTTVLVANHPHFCSVETHYFGIVATVGFRLTSLSARYYVIMWSHDVLRTIRGKRLLTFTVGCMQLHITSCKKLSV